MNRQKLEAAAQKGIISQEQVDNLLNFFASDNPQWDGVNSEEPLRFIRSFGDIFITLGIVLVSFAIAKMNVGGFGHFMPLIVLLFLTEWLVGVHRLALPGIALLGAILLFSYKIILSLSLDFGLMDFSQAQLIASVGMIMLSGLFYWRYKMPFAFFTMAGGLLLFIHNLLGLDVVTYPLIFAVYGGAVFFVAMWFDAKDVKRLNHFSDTGFWLHMLAAPLIARGVMFAIFQSNSASPFSILVEDSMFMREIFVILFFLGFFLIALFIDRRALMVSSLVFALAALLNIFKMELLHNMEMIWLIFAVLGLAMVIVGVNWYSIRALIFGRLRDDGISRFVPAFGVNGGHKKTD